MICKHKTTFIFKICNKITKWFSYVDGIIKLLKKKYFKLHQRRLWITARTNYQIVLTSLVQSVQCVRHCTRHGPKPTVLCFVAIVQVIPIFVMAKTFFESTKQLLFLNSAMQLQIWVLNVIIDIIKMIINNVQARIFVLFARSFFIRRRSSINYSQSIIS